MTTPETAATTPAGHELYLEVQHFYARQMRLIDDGAVDEWARTFTEDGVFEANAQPAPTRGRTAIAAAAGKAARKYDEDGVRRRHWLGMLQVDVEPGGDIVARSYAQVLNTPRGGQADLRISCTCDDVLVRDRGQLRVRHRRIRRDDLE